MLGICMVCVPVKCTHRPAICHLMLDELVVLYSYTARSPHLIQWYSLLSCPLHYLEL